MSNFTIEGRMKGIPDVQRNWMWQLFIPGIKTVAPTAIRDTEDLIIRCRNINIPSRTNTPSTSEWMGMKQHFPGKPDIGGTVVATFEETEDLIIRKIFWEWEQNLYNVNPDSPNAGKSSSPLKRLLTKDMFLFFYGYNGVKLQKSIRFHNSFIQQVGDVSLDYSSNDSVKYSVTFQYDFWTLFPDIT